MSDNKMIWLGIVAVILALGLIFMVWRTTEQAASSQLQVIGDARMLVVPDQAELYVYVDTTAKTSLDSQQQNAEISSAVVAALKAAGLKDENIQTSAYTIVPEYFYPENRAPVLNDYKTTNGLKLIIHDVQQVGKIIDAASNAGANRIENIQFELSDAQSDKMKQIVLNNAAGNAKLKAIAIAQSIGVSLGKVKMVSESYYTVVPYSLQLPKVAEAAAQPAPPTPIQPGNVEVTAQVSVTYEI